VGSRPDRPGFSQLQKKKFGGGNLKNNQNPGLAGRVSLWLANGGAWFRRFLGSKF
jgi:hypothetical protein